MKRNCGAGYTALVLLALVDAPCSAQPEPIPLPPIDDDLFALNEAPAVTSELLATPLEQTSSEVLINLDELSTEELLELYATTYEESLRGQAFDLSRLALPGHVIVQSGYTYSADTDELEFTTTEHSFPELLIRYRILKRLEIRGGWAGVAINTLTDDLTGIEDRDTRTINPTFGVRVGLWDQNGLLPRASLTASTPYDMDAQGAFRDHLNPRASIGYSWLLDDTTLLSASTGLIWTEDDGEQYTDLRQSLSWATFVHKKLDLHVTWQAILPEGRSVEDLSHSIGPGFSFRFTPKKQIDLITSFGVDEPSPDVVLQVLFTTKL